MQCQVSVMSVTPVLYSLYRGWQTGWHVRTNTDFPTCTRIHTTSTHTQNTTDLRYACDGTRTIWKVPLDSGVALEDSTRPTHRIATLLLPWFWWRVRHPEPWEMNTWSLQTTQSIIGHPPVNKISMSLWGPLSPRKEVSVLQCRGLCLPPIASLREST